MNARRWHLAALLLATVATARADGPDEAPFPPAGFPGDRYAALWTKSPFAIATPEAASGSADYSLVGLAQFDGVSYASLVEKPSGEHFVLASDKPVRNLTLVSIAHRSDGPIATIRQNGEILTLRLETTAPPPTALPPMMQMPNAPPGSPPPFSNVGGMGQQFNAPPPVRFHRRPIAVPPRPQ